MDANLLVRSSVLMARSATAQERSRALLHAVHERRSRFFHQLKRPRNPRSLRFFPVGGAAGAFLKIETEERDNAYIVHLSGEVDLANARLLYEALDGGAHSSRNAILDCQHLTYIDSAGFHLLENLRTRGRRLIVVAPAPSIQRVFEILGFDLVIPIVSSVQEALKVLAKEDIRPTPADP